MIVELIAAVTLSGGVVKDQHHVPNPIRAIARAFHREKLWCSYCGRRVKHYVPGIIPDHRGRCVDSRTKVDHKDLSQ